MLVGGSSVSSSLRPIARNRGGLEQWNHKKCLYERGPFQHKSPPLHTVGNSAYTIHHKYIHVYLALSRPNPATTINNTDISSVCINHYHLLRSSGGGMTMACCRVLQVILLATAAIIGAFSEHFAVSFVRSRSWIASFTSLREGALSERISCVKCVPNTSSSSLHSLTRQMDAVSSLKASRAVPLRLAELLFTTRWRKLSFSPFSQVRDQESVSPSSSCEYEFMLYLTLYLSLGPPCQQLHTCLLLVYYWFDLILGGGGIPVRPPLCMQPTTIDTL